MNELADHRGIQALLLAAVSSFILHVVARYRAGDLGRVAAGAWILAWAVGGLAVLFPGSATRAANAIGVGRGADLVIYLSLVALFYGVFRLLVRQARLDRTLTELVREAALAEKRREDDAPPVR